MEPRSRRELLSPVHDQRFSNNQRSNVASSSSSYSMLTQMLDKQPNEILAEMIQINFSIKQFLNDKRMETEKDWIVTITKLFERITTVASQKRYFLIK
ncbi:unnamed protein product [Adineta steineri]|uniref:Uncharacterized protein n=1 Tax=Adineta steineri TaxID=433720 RepID=A0A815KSV9_9BILA|nr:unnamed protein product [Adineta steineri]